MSRKYPSHEADGWQYWSLGNMQALASRQTPTSPPKPQRADSARTQSPRLCWRRVRFAFFGTEAGFALIHQKEKNKASQFTHHLNVHAPPSPSYHLPLCTNKGACVKARVRQFSSSHACHSVWQGLLTHMQMITTPFPNASWSTNWMLMVSPK